MEESSTTVLYVPKIAYFFINEVFRKAILPTNDAVTGVSMVDFVRYLGHESHKNLLFLRKNPAYSLAM